MKFNEQSFYNIFLLPCAFMNHATFTGFLIRHPNLHGPAMSATHSGRLMKAKVLFVYAFKSTNSFDFNA